MLQKVWYPRLRPPPRGGKVPPWQPQWQRYEDDRSAFPAAGADGAVGPCPAGHSAGQSELPDPRGRQDPARPVAAGVVVGCGGTRRGHRGGRSVGSGAGRLCPPARRAVCRGVLWRGDSYRCRWDRGGGPCQPGAAYPNRGRHRVGHPRPAVRVFTGERRSIGCGHQTARPVRDQPDCPVRGDCRGGRRGGRPMAQHRPCQGCGGGTGYHR